MPFNIGKQIGKGAAVDARNPNQKSDTFEVEKGGFVDDGSRKFFWFTVSSVPAQGERGFILLDRVGINYSDLSNPDQKTYDDFLAMVREKAENLTQNVANVGNGP